MSVVNTIELNPAEVFLATTPSDELGNPVDALDFLLQNYSEKAETDVKYKGVAAALKKVREHYDRALGDAEVFAPTFAICGTAIGSVLGLLATVAKGAVEPGLGMTFDSIPFVEGMMVGMVGGITTGVITGEYLKGQATQRVSQVLQNLRTISSTFGGHYA